MRRLQRPLAKRAREGGRGAHKRCVNVGDQEFDELLLNVERFYETWEPRFEDVSQAILIEKPHEAGVGTLRNQSNQLVSSKEGDEKLTSGSK